MQIVRGPQLKAKNGIYLLKLCELRAERMNESELNWSYFVVGGRRGEAKSCGQSGYKSNQKTRQDEWPQGWEWGSPPSYKFIWPTRRRSQTARRQDPYTGNINVIYIW